MNRELSSLLRTAPLPGELEAQRRTWSVVQAAYAEREPRRRQRRAPRAVLVFAALAAVVAVAVSPVGGWIHDRFQGEPAAEPALFRLPGGGRLLVVSERGPWVVRPDGSKRLLGGYENASFSPRGKFVVVTRGRRVTAVEPDGDPRWSLTRPQMVAQARWAPSGFRVAYRAGTTLRVVVGDGTDDHLLARGVATVAPAWRPGPVDENVLAFADTKGRVHVVDVDSRRELSRSKPGPPVRKLLWQPGARRPFVLRRGPVLDAAYAPDGTLAFARFDAGRDETTVFSSDCPPGKACKRVARRLFSGAGRLDRLTWSPDGRWLVVSWPDADQLLFLRLPGVRKVVAVSGIRREFDPGGEGAAPFPRVAGWSTAP